MSLTVKTMALETLKWLVFVGGLALTQEHEIHPELPWVGIALVAVTAFAHRLTPSPGQQKRIDQATNDGKILGMKLAQQGDGL